MIRLLGRAVWGAASHPPSGLILRRGYAAPGGKPKASFQRVDGQWVRRTEDGTSKSPGATRAKRPPRDSGRGKPKPATTASGGSRGKEKWQRDSKGGWGKQKQALAASGKQPTGGADAAKGASGLGVGQDADWFEDEMGGDDEILIPLKVKEDPESKPRSRGAKWREMKSGKPRRKEQPPKGARQPRRSDSKPMVMRFEKPAKYKKKQKRRVVTIGEVISVEGLAELLEQETEGVLEVLQQLNDDGKYAEPLDLVSPEDAELLVMEAGLTPRRTYADFEDAVPVAADDAELLARVPVVSVMGHVDHGKTTLLDALRETSLADEEAGGITQRIGAFRVLQDGTTLSVFDTPGHASFKSMRSSSVQLTDVVVLCVAADDGAKPQTIECINLIRRSGVQLVVAITKIDKYEADIDGVKQELMRHGVIADELGGG